MPFVTCRHERVPFPRDSTRECCEGYTLLEVLLAVAVLAVGLTYLSQTFCRSVSVMQHLTHRISFHRFVEESAPEVQRLIDREQLWGEYRESEQLSSDPAIEGTVSIRRLEAYHNLYQCTLSGRWTEGDRHIALERSFFLRRR